MTTPGNQSEVARLLARIDAETVAANRALNDPALGTAQHSFISARMENIQGCHEQLATIIDPAIAAQLVIERMDAALAPPPQELSPDAKAH